MPILPKQQGDDQIARIMNDIEVELRNAVRKFKPFNSAHEGYAVLKEEVDELWDDIKDNNRHGAWVEARQVAAMAARFILDTNTQRDFDNTNDGLPK